MENYAIKGMEQLRIELSVGGGLSILLALLGFVLFFMFSQFELLIIGCLGSAPIFVFLLMKPYTRIKILRMFQNKEIKL
ncbi:hypothetical protein ACW2QC_00240 [Virgibacillus sp. FSP13]